MLKVETAIQAILDMQRKLAFVGAKELLQADELEAFLEHLTSFVPFKVGDIVEIVDPVDINPKESWGWMAYKNLLVKGCRGRIIEVRLGVDLDGGKGNISVLFQPEGTKSNFHYWAYRLKKVGESPTLEFDI